MSKFWRPVLFLVIICNFLLAMSLLLTRSFEDWFLAENIHECRYSEKYELSFSSQMATIPWESFTRAVNTSNVMDQTFYSNMLLTALLPFLEKAPEIPINESCSSPPLSLPTSYNCTPLKTPRKIGILLQFGFDVDILEIHLHELNATVDKFFLIESIKPHSSYATTKPLMWDRLKYDKRFVQFAEKMVHFIVDDMPFAVEEGKMKTDNGTSWIRESLQERLRWEKFVVWNRATKYFQGDDLLGFGDVDEIPFRNNVYFLKHCELPSDPIDIGIWFPVGGLNKMFHSDFPAKHTAFTLGDPTFWTLNAAWKHSQISGEFPSRRRGNSTNSLVGGMHMSSYAYSPFRMVKMLVATEVGVGRVHDLIKVGKLFASGKAKEADEKMNYFPKSLRWRVRSLDKVRKNITLWENKYSLIVKIPWFYECNRARYPSLDNLPDSRLD